MRQPQLVDEQRITINSIHNERKTDEYKLWADLINLMHMRWTYGCNNSNLKWTHNAGMS